MIRVLNRMGRGYSLPVLRARLLYGIHSCLTSKQKQSNESTGVDVHSRGVPISTLLFQDQAPGSDAKNTTESI